IAISTTIPLSILALASAAVLIIFLRKRNKKNRRNRQRTSHQHLLASQNAYEMAYVSPSAKYLPPRSPGRSHPSKRVFKRIFSRGKAHASPPPKPPMGVFLPAWAQNIAGSNKSSSAKGDYDDGDGVEDRMVQ